MTAVSLMHLHKSYGEAGFAVHDVSMDIAPGKLTALLGPSGCGKTTVLKMIAGLLRPTTGDILFDGSSVLPVAPERRGAVLVFQKPLLFPYLSVADNVGFGLKMRGVAAKEIRRRVAAALALVRLAGYENRAPHRLSGGQQQRVALARALVIEPRVLLLDEPLASLDANLRVEMRAEILAVQRACGITTIFVTHDQQEAVLLAERVALITAGRVLQYDEPRAFYERPASIDVARFFGGVNFMEGTRRGDLVATPLGDLRVKAAGADGPVTLTIRPEHIRFDGNDPNRLKATIESRTYLGTQTMYRLRHGDQTLEAVSTTDSDYTVGGVVDVVLPAEKLWPLRHS